MARGSSGQRYIGQNRKPRVHIEYVLDTNGSSEKIQLPFVMGVISDLSGETENGTDLGSRKFEEFTSDNFAARMAEISPSVTVTIDTALTPAGTQLEAPLVFRSMEDFSPGAIAKQVPMLRKLLEDRKALDELASDMSGKPGAQDAVSELLEKIRKKAASGETDA